MLGVCVCVRVCVRQGCFTGCENCTAIMPAGGNQVDHPPPGCTPLEPTLPETARTYNLKNLSANGDWTRYHPWRAPGRAPVSDPCGVAGAYTESVGGGGETPPGATQGDKGSELPAGESEKWPAGGTAEVGWMIDANVRLPSFTELAHRRMLMLRVCVGWCRDPSQHGGGYIYSVCPKSSALTEECFNQHVLSFVGSTHTIRYLDGRPELEIPARDVSVGTFPPKSAWRINPIPACNCDVRHTGA